MDSATGFTVLPYSCSLSGTTCSRTAAIDGGSGSLVGPTLTVVLKGRVLQQATSTSCPADTLEFTLTLTAARDDPRAAQLDPITGAWVEIGDYFAEARVHWDPPSQGSPRWPNYAEWQVARLDGGFEGFDLHDTADGRSGTVFLNGDELEKFRFRVRNTNGYAASEFTPEIPFTIGFRAPFLSHGHPGASRRPPQLGRAAAPSGDGAGNRARAVVRGRRRHPYPRGERHPAGNGLPGFPARRGWGVPLPGPVVQRVSPRISVHHELGDGRAFRAGRPGPRPGPDGSGFPLDESQPARDGDHPRSGTRAGPTRRSRVSICRPPRRSTGTRCPRRAPTSTPSWAFSPTGIGTRGGLDGDSDGPGARPRVDGHPAALRLAAPGARRGGHGTTS